MKNKWLCLPKQQFATKGFAATKFLLLIFFFTTLVLNIAWTVTTIRVYRHKVADIKAATRFPSRSEIQVYTTHSHFFLFSGLLSSAVLAVGFWGILMEYLVVMAAFSWACGVVCAFEIIGAYQSYDPQVQLYKAFSIAPEPVLMVLGLVFAHMIRVCERKLVNDPLYKKKMAEQKSKGETGTDFNVIDKRASIESDEMDNNNMSSKGGVDNAALDIDDEVNRIPLDPGVADKPRPSSASGSADTAPADHEQMNTRKDDLKDSETLTTARDDPEAKKKPAADVVQEAEFINIELREGS